MKAQKGIDLNNIKFLYNQKNCGEIFKKKKITELKTTCEPK